MLYNLLKNSTQYTRIDCKAPSTISLDSFRHFTHPESQWKPYKQSHSTRRTCHPQLRPSASKGSTKGGVLRKGSNYTDGARKSLSCINRTKQSRSSRAIVRIHLLGDHSNAPIVPSFLLLLLSLLLSFHLRLPLAALSARTSSFPKIDGFTRDDSQSNDRLTSISDRLDNYPRLGLASITTFGIQIHLESSMDSVKSRLPVESIRSARLSNFDDSDDFGDGLERCVFSTDLTKSYADFRSPKHRLVRKDWLV